MIAVDRGDEPSAHRNPDRADGLYVVGRDKDTLLDSYDGYSPHGVTLGHRPIAGKVAVMALGGKAAGGAPRAELSFYLGGKRLKAYTAADRARPGVNVERRTAWTPPADIRAVGCEQMGRTNDYAFVIEGPGTKRLSFDILTGLVRKAPVD